MGQPFLGEIRMFGGSFAPAGWEFCNGQLLPISENTALFNLIGTTYGGDGVSSFALPDLRGRAPVHQGTSQGTNYTIGEAAGTETVTLTVSQIPNHNHIFLATPDAANSEDPTNQILASSQAQIYYNAKDNPAPMSPSAIGLTGGSQPHDNMQPFMCVSFIISVFGVFPSQN